MKTNTAALAALQPEQKPIFGSKPEPRPDVKAGDIFYNPKRGNCLRVLRIYDPAGYPGATKRVACISFRPNGEKGTTLKYIEADQLWCLRAGGVDPRGAGRWAGD